MTEALLDGHQDENFLPLVERLCHDAVEPGTRPDIILADPIQSNGIRWITVRYRTATPRRDGTPTQGWKLHISAYHPHAEEVLRQVVPVLSRRAVPWKCAPSRLNLQSLNQGEGGLSQIGKFITVYPATDEESVALARELDAATLGLEGPAVPSDRALYPGCLVHYRYGGFAPFQVQNAIGQIFHAIRLPDGSFVKDVRSASYRAPQGIEDPFERAGLYVAAPPPPRLFGGRFFYISTIHRNARNSIHLTVDLQAGKQAIVKQVSLSSRVGKEDVPASEMLRHEARVLEAIGDDEHLPSFYALFEQGGELYLAMEDLDAVTMERFISERQVAHQLPSTADVLRWAKALVRMLAPVHAGGWIHRDLKSTNVLVTADEQMRLIDFDISTPIATTSKSLGFGTRGYQSPQQLAGEPATVQDDIYGVGAVLYGLATLTETSQAPTPERLLDRPLARLNPRLHPALCRLIERCIAPQSSDRHDSLAALGAALDAISETAERPLEVARSTDEAARREQQAPRLREDAIRLADSLLKSARPLLDGEGLAWPSTHSEGAGIRSREFNTGSAGVLYALTEFAARLGDERYVDAVARGARWLAGAPRISDPLVPGLYIGEAGIAAALLRAGQLLGDSALLEAALRRGDLVAAAPLTSPDLFNGAAGRMRLHLWLWAATGEGGQLAHARTAAGHLLRSREGGKSGEAYWRFTEELDGFGGQTQLGYAHGAAGIGDALLDLYEATGDAEAASVATGATRWLLAQERPVFDGLGAAWTLNANGSDAPSPLRSGFWCHGAAGIGLFLARIGKLGLLPEALDSARRAARAVAFATRWASPTVCHGLAGNLDFLVTIYQATGDPTFLDHAHTFGMLLQSFMQEKDGLWVVPSEYYSVVSPDYMVGYSGAALALLRLTMADDFPHPFREPALRAPALVPSA